MTGNSNEVAQLQNQLIDLGYPVDDPAGMYGPSTTAGVRGLPTRPRVAPGRRLPGLPLPRNCAT